MSTPRQILAAIFDMDGLLVDSEPLWDQAELDVIASLGVDISRRHELPDTLGLRIDMVVDLWFTQQPWNDLHARKSPSASYPAQLRWLKKRSRCCQGCAKPWRYANHRESK